MNRDFVEILAGLSAAEAEFLVVGAHALAAHGCPRATGAIDIWIRPTPENAQRVWMALARFGAPIRDLTVRDLSNPNTVFQMGLPPNRIDIIVQIDGVVFEKAWPSRVQLKLGDLSIPVIGRADLIANKRAAGRPKDLADVAWIEAKR